MLSILENIRDALPASNRPDTIFIQDMINHFSDIDSSQFLRLEGGAC
ncbi:hypothetical protein PLANPX_2401 [Lacipirellula parvula]|uniref:Uncharacterized protein n=1 Tax=Lacipirellula parvula TaxID=2650471 RepID=A0A5K7XIR5_9BACT|nr:hypothetical protein PLANPX_2401 [Lacipirellula parvula]